jgi:CubicO group peptidase (beta-lactamase class C family)
MREFSGFVMVVRAGETLVSRGYGAADFEQRQLANERTGFAVGSVTKTMTAAAIRLLVNDGKVRMQDPVTKFLPGFAHGDSITIAHLLGHASGLKDYYQWPMYASRREQDVTPAEFLAELQKLPLDFATGAKSAYSNSGYFVLAEIIQRASGESFASFIARRLFRPLGMSDAGSLDQRPSGQRLAKGYDPGFPPTRVQPAAPVSPSWLAGSGSVHASARDLQRWLQAHLDGAVVGREWTSAAYGWGKRVRFKHEMWEQNGRVPIGYASYVGLYPRTSLMVIVLGNIQSEVSERIGVGLAAIALGEAYEPSVLRAGVRQPPQGDSALFATYAGRYQIAPDFVLTVQSLNHGILIAGPDGAFLPADHEGPDRFYFRPLSVPIAFTRDGDGRIAALDWGGQFQAARLAADVDDRRRKKARAPD